MLSQKRMKINHAKRKSCKKQSKSKISKPKIGLATINARSVNNKVSVIWDAIYEHNLDLCAITETWLKSIDGPIIHQLSDKNYSYVGKNREHKKGGGVGLIFNKNVKVRPIELKNYVSFELLALDVHSDNRHIVLYIIYRPPNAASFQTFFAEFRQLLDVSVNITDNVVYTGDFNIAVNIDSKETREFNNILSEYGLKQYVTFATHILGNTLDLIITKENQKIITRCN